MTGWPRLRPRLILEDGTRLEGRGIGAIGHAAGEVCFNTAMTGWEIWDPLLTRSPFTFPIAYKQRRGVWTLNSAALGHCAASLPGKRPYCPCLTPPKPAGSRAEIGWGGNEPAALSGCLPETWWSKAHPQAR